MNRICNNVKWKIDNENKKIISFNNLCNICSLPTHSKIIKRNTKKNNVKTVKQAGYTVATARTEAFKDVKTALSLVHYKSDLIDKFYDVNMSYLDKNVYSPYDESRLIIPSYLGTTLISYGVRYADKNDRVYYYNSKGKLIRIEFDDNNPEKYPKRTITYNNSGHLHAVVLYISNKEQYNFDGKGNLIVHWIGERGFNRSGELMKIRRKI